MSIRELNFKDGPVEENFSIREKNVWVNNILNPTKIPLICRVPQKISIVMRSIEMVMNSSGLGALEFGAFLKGSFTEEGILVVSEDFYIGEQRVSGASIDFDEEPPNTDFNGVIHRHPNGCKGFSGTDDSSINRNYEFSLLYVNNVISLGVFNLQHDNLRIQLPLRVEVMYPIVNFEMDDILKKIKKREIVISSSRALVKQDSSLMFPETEDLDSYLRGFEDSEEPEVADNGIPYICKTCGEVIMIDEFPIQCGSCDALLDEGDVVVVDDINVEINEDEQPEIIELGNEE